LVLNQGGSHHSLERSLNRLHRFLFLFSRSRRDKRPNN